MATIPNSTELIYLTYEASDGGKNYLSHDESFKNTDLPILDVLITHEESEKMLIHSPDGATEAAPAYGQDRRFTVFAQGAMIYGKYSDYMRKHGCACCALTTMLRAYSNKYCELSPEETLAIVEKTHVPRMSWYINYLRPMLLQMPIMLYGISRILESEGIANRYIRCFTDDEAVKEIKKHLLSGRPVIVKTSRKRRDNSKIADRRDTKYAGTNHTQILLGMTRAGKVIYADSAKRSWSGDRQRLKETELEDMINYMFPQQIKSNANYYWGRKRTGGYILIDVPLIEIPR